MKKFQEKFINEEIFTELDLVYPFYSDDGSEERNEVETYPARFSETVSINIDIIIECLQELKKQGADRVYIAQHCDHHEYYITGVKLIET